MMMKARNFTLGILLLCSFYGYGHDRSYEMTIDNFIKHNPDINVYDITLEGIIREYDTYKEIILVMKNDEGKTLGKFLEFNNAFPNAGYYKGNSYYKYDPQKHFDATVFNWLTTFGFRTKNFDYIWHDKVSCYRWNAGMGVIDRGFFEDIIRDGEFEVVFENHQLKWNSNREVLTGKRTVYVTNPEVFEEFLKVPISSYLPFDFRRKLRSAINVLSFDSLFYKRLRRN